MIGLALLLLLAGCATTTPWQVDAIAAGNQAFNSSRLVYRSGSHSPLAFEMYKMGDRIEAFLSLSRFKLSPDSKLAITIEGETLEEKGVPHEGGMRLRLSEEITGCVIHALQEGKKVAILVDGFEETLEPDQFSPSFIRFVGGESRFPTLLKGPFP